MLTSTTCFLTAAFTVPANTLWFKEFIIVALLLFPVKRLNNFGPKKYKKFLKFEFKKKSISKQID